MSGLFHFLSRITSGQQQRSEGDDGGDHAGVATSGHGHRTYRLQRSAPVPLQGELRPPSFLWPALTEAVLPSTPGPEPFPPAPGNRRPFPPQRRLTPWGQVLLAAALLLAGLTVYLGAWEISRRMTTRGEICLKLPSTPPSEAHAGSTEHNQLLREYEIGKVLIRDLPAASPGQRLRLKEQLHSLVRDLDSLCHLNIYYYSEESALLTAATSSATLLMISLVLLAPQGLQNISRGVRTVLFTAGAILGVSVNFLQLGQQQENGAKAQQMYRGQYALLQRFTSSLANQRIEAGISASKTLPSLTTPLAVAQLITAIDTKRLSMPDPRMDLDSSLAEQTWSHLLQGDEEPAPGDDPPPTPASPTRPRPSSPP